jgi:tRNA threonylcarbamoyladenosine biosynthesis protein TsaB
VAVARNGTVVHEFEGDSARTHGQRLPVDLMHALEQAHVRIDDVDLLAIAAGPGSFTGLRVGIATVQGLAMARDLKVVPVSTLEALARVASASARPDMHVAAWMDAQRGEVFAALYRPGLTGLVVEPSAASPAATLDAWEHEAGGVTLQFVGDGAVRYRDLIAARFGDRASLVHPTPPLAGIIARIAGERAHGAVRPHALVPVYVRRPDAELARARRASSTPSPGV